MTEKVFKISGMHCAACSSSIERFMSRQSGVENVSVNLTTEKMNISYDDSCLDTDKICELVAGLSFGAEEYVSADAMARDARKKEEAEKAAELESMKRRVILCICFALPLLYVSMGHMIGLPLPRVIDPHYAPLAFAAVQLVLTLPVVIGGRNFYINGFGSLVKGHPNMDTLVAIGTFSALLYGIYSLIRIALGDVSFAGNLFFESATVVISLVLLGKYLEARSKHHTSDAIRALTELAPETATVTRHGETDQVPVSELREGDVITVRPGERFPCDGVVTNGISSADLSMLTGESLPVTLEEGGTVTGGSINGEGVIVFSATKVGGDTTLAQIIRMVEDAQGKKAPIAKIADRVAGVFVPVVMGIALLAAIIWAIAGKDIEFVLNVFVSVLVVACPCSLGLATPTAIMVGTGRGAELGVLYKSGEALQAMAFADTAVLDKTGTVTEGKPRLTSVYAVSNTEDELLAMCAAAESGSEHPIAKAITEAAKERELPIPSADNITAIPGRGIKAQVGGQQLLIGNATLMEENKIEISAADKAAELENSGCMLMFAACDGLFAGLFGAVDTIKPDSPNAISDLHNNGITTIMLTGDNENATNAIAKTAGIDNVIAGVLPEGKAGEIEKLKAEGRKVCMVGDGINDAPALAAADTAIAMGGGTDVAIESSDITLLGVRLSAVPDALAVSRATMGAIRLNLAWALLYNVLSVGAAAFGVVNPSMAAAAMSLSSIAVLMNSLRLKKAEEKK